MAVAERVMGWKTRIVPTVQFISGYVYDSDDSRIYGSGPDFHADHNAAAMVRARVGELEAQRGFILALAIAAVGRHGYVPYNDGSWEFWTEALIKLLSASPEQIARAAYAAVTKESLEAVDE